MTNKGIHHHKHVIIALLTVLMTSCYTPAKEKQVQGDIYALQTRVLKLESELQDRSSTLNKAKDQRSKTLAANTTSLEKISVNVQRLQGEIDRLKEGIRLGAIPGEEEPETSVNNRLSKLSERMEEIEKAQEEILSIIRTAKRKPSSGKSSKKITTYNELKKAYSRKRFSEIKSYGPSVLKKLSGKSKKKGTFFYAESLYKTNNFRDAALQFNDYLESTPPKDKDLVLSKLRMGDCYRKLGDKNISKIYYEEVISQHPESEYVKFAKERLKEVSG